MTGYEPPVLNQIAFAFGMGAAMFWPVWLAAFAVGALTFARRHRLSGGALMAAALIPAAIFGVFTALIQLGVDVGPRDGLAARALEAGSWPFIGFTGVCLIGVLLIAGRALVVRMSSKGRAAHA